MHSDSLLIQILSLLKQEPDLEALARLLEQAPPESEVQVARVLAKKAAHPILAPRLRSLDPRERLEALRIALRIYDRRSFVQVLRRAVRDPDHPVRLFARRVLFNERFNDVALPDGRYQPAVQTSPWPYPLGGFNPSGWSAGLFRNARMSGRYSHPDRLRPERLQTERDAARGLVPAIEDQEALAALLSLDEKDLRRFCRPGCKPGSAYVEFQVPKRSGGERTLAAPRAPLKKIQRAILERILNPLPVHPACHAYTKGRSLLTNTAPHQRAKLIIKTDLRDFFPSITYPRVFGLFSYYGYETEVAAVLARLTTYRPCFRDGKIVRFGVLPQGAPTSGAIANLLCRQLDARLVGLATKLKGHYTRYADDLTFSFPADPAEGIGRFFWWVDQICAQEGFAEQPTKRRVLRPQNRQVITGVVVNEGQRVSRKDRRRFRALLHRLETTGADEQGRNKVDLRSYVFGYASYLRMVQPDAGEKLLEQVRKLYSRP